MKGLAPAAAFVAVLLLSASAVFPAIGPGTFAPIQQPPPGEFPFRLFTLLPDNRILATGPGQVYFVDPATRQLEPVVQQHFRKWNHTATLLPDGRVLLAGGQVPNRIFSGPGAPMTACEIIDPVARTTTDTGAFVVSARGRHAAAHLPDGRVVVLGGFNLGGPWHNICEIWDPATGTWSDAGRLVHARIDHHAFLLENGKVLVVGGHTSSIELYDPATMTSQIVANLPFIVGDAAVLRLAGDGRILIFGGGTPTLPGRTVYAFNPLNNEITTVGSLTTWYGGGIAVQLQNGLILLLGASSTSGGRDKGELFNLATGRSVLTQTAGAAMGPNVSSSETADSAVLLPDGRVALPWQIYDPNGVPTVTRGDFEFNDRADIVWYNSVTRNGSLWSMNGLSASGRPFGSSVSGVTLRALGDFDGGGIHDLLYRTTTADGQFTIRYIGPNGTTVGNRTFTAPEIPLDWVVAGTADADGDGREDVFWKHPTLSDQLHLWLMDESGVRESAPFPGVAEPGWILAAIDDFDGDGRADVFWRHSGRGENYIWFLDGFIVERAGHTVPVPDQQFQIEGSGDFNADGKADLVWHNDTTGQAVIWLMDGLNANGSGTAGTPPGGWRLAFAADFSGDNKYDLFWRNPATGQNWVWLMDGFNVQSSSSIPSVNDPNWVPMVP